MKKIYALILATVLLFSVSVPVLADNVISPTGTPTEDENQDLSPTTGDISLVYVGAAGIALAATAVVTAVKTKKEA